MAGATINFTLRADTAAGVAAIEKMSGSLKGMGSTAEESAGRGAAAATAFGGALGSVRTILASLGIVGGIAAVGSAIRSSITDAMEFNKEWMKVSVILRDTPAQEVELLKQKILEMDPALGTAKDKASALYQAISSGVTDPQQALHLVEQAAIAASGGFTTVETALKSGAAVLNAYGLTAQDSQHIFDVMAKTVDLGVVSFEELATQLGVVIPIAAANNVSFEELSAAVAALTLQGLPAAQAITSLRSVMTSLLEPSKEASDTAKQLGIQWNAQALASMGLSGILGQLQGKTGITTEQMAKLVGRVEAMNAIMALTSQSGAEKFRFSLEQISHASDGAGASMDAHKKSLESLPKQWDIFTTSLTNMAAAAGSAVAPALASMLSNVSGFVNSLANGEVPVNAFTFAVGAMATTLAGFSLAGLIGAVGSLGSAFSALSILALVRDFESARIAINLLADSIGLTYATLGPFGTAIAVAGAAFVGWQIGALIRDLTGLGGVLDDLFLKIRQQAPWWSMGFMKGTSADIAAGQSQQLSNLQAAADAIATRFPQLASEVQRGSLSLDGWAQAIAKAQSKARELDPAFAKLTSTTASNTDSTKKNTDAARDNAEAIKKRRQEMEKASVAAMDAIIKEFHLREAMTKQISESIGSIIGKIEDPTEALEKLKEPLHRFFEEFAVEQSIAIQFHIKAEESKKALDEVMAWQMSVFQANLDNDELFAAQWFEKQRDKTKGVFTNLTNQISTITTDLGKRLAEGIMSGDFFRRPLEALKAFGTAMLRVLMETFLSPFMKMLSEGISGLLSGKGFGGFKLPDLFGGKGSQGGIVSTGGFAGPLSKFFGGMPELLGAAIGGTTLGAGALGKLFGGGKMGAVSGGAAGLLATATIMGLAGKGGMLTALLGPLGISGPVGAMILGAIAAIAPLMKLFKKNPLDAASKELGRDFGGIGIDTEGMKSFLGQIGITQDQFKGIRKDILASPKFLTEIAYPLAQAQGKTEQFLASLQNVQTAWGTFDFRTPFEEGLKAGGSFEALNAAFVKAFGSSQALTSIMPDFATRLAAVATGAGDAASKIDEVAEAAAAFNAMIRPSDELIKTLSLLEQAGISTSDIWMVYGDRVMSAAEQQLKFGQTLDPLIQKYYDYGKGLEAARLATERLVTDTEKLIARFEQTGVISPELQATIEKFGGNMQAFRDAMQLPDLEAMRSGFAAIRAEVEKLLPKEVSPFESFIQAGTITDALRAKIIAAGGDVAAFEKFAALRQARGSLEELVTKFKSTGELSSDLSMILLQWASGWSQGMAISKENIDALAQSARTNLGNALTESAVSLKQQLDLMDENLTAAIDRLRTALTAAIQELIDAIRGIGTAAAETVNEVNKAMTQLTDLPEQPPASYVPPVGPGDGGSLITPLPPPPLYVPPGGGSESGVAPEEAGEYLTGNVNLNVQLNVTLESTNELEAERYANDILIPVIVDAISSNRRQSRELISNALLGR